MASNLEVIKALIGVNYPIEDATFEEALKQSGIDPTAENELGKAFDMSLITLIVLLFSFAERISEGGYTVQLNLDALQRLLDWLYWKWGIPNPNKPYLIDRTNRW